MANLNIDVQPRGTASAYVEAPFDKAKALLNENGYRVISLEENARLRMQEGKDAKVSRYGNWTREGFVYVPKKGVFLVRNSPILDDPEKATKAHYNGQDFYPTEEQVEKALEDSVLIPFKSSINIPTNRFGNEDITTFAFGDQAKAYGKFLRDVGIKEMPIYLANKQSKPFVRQLWFGGVGFRSELGGNYRGLCYGDRCRGYAKDAEGVAKISESYSIKDFRKALKDSGVPGIEKLVIKNLPKR